MRPGFANRLIGLALLVPVVASAQTESRPSSMPPGLSLAARLSADTIAIGDAFDLQLTVALPAGWTLFLPDSLDSAEGLAPGGPVIWTEDASDDESSLTVTYPLIALDVGIVEVSSFDISVVSGALVGGPRVRFAAGLGDPSSQSASVERLAVPEQRIWVASVLLLEDITQGIVPRPAADVWGGDWHWPSMFLIAAFTLVLGGVLTVSARDLVGRSGHDPASSTQPLAPRALALDSLDRLLASGIHIDGHVDMFYRQTSDVLRRYAETLDEAWGAALTSTELMHALEARYDREAESRLKSEMSAAERVKFGRHRPSAEVAESHLQTLRDWIVGPAGPTS